MSKKGFTLVEVVVAVAILGVGLGVIMELFSGGLRLGRISQEYTKAANYAWMKMEEISLKPASQEGTEEGEFDDVFRWRVAVKKVDILQVDRGTDFKPPVELFQVNIVVDWKSGSRERSISVESYQAVKVTEGEKGRI